MAAKSLAVRFDNFLKVVKSFNENLKCYLKFAAGYGSLAV
jgi:hypothetical protein